LLNTRRIYFIADALGVCAADVNAMILGSHGDEMVPLPAHTSISGIPLGELMSAEEIQRIVERTRDGGGEIVRYLKTGSAFYAPSAAVVDMVESVLRDKRKVMPVSVYPGGEYGLDHIYIGLPVILGKKGVERIIELDLGEVERKLLARSAEKIRQDIEHLKDCLICI